MTDNDLWDLLTDGMNKNYPMVAGTKSNNEIDHIVDGHAYAVLGTQKLYNPDGTLHVRLVKMRNPWGKFEYTGPYSGKSGDWTPAFK